MTQTQTFKRTLLATALSATFALTGCGGGGGGGTTNDGGGTTPTDSFTGSVEGTAAKGIIQKGVVTAYELDTNGNVLRNLGETTTDDEGKYSLPISSEYTDGPIKVTVTATSESTMICDVQGTSDCTFGQPVALPTDFSMDSVLPEAVEDEAISVPITPLTHMAASRALASGAVSKDSVNAAVSEVNQLAGVNILETEPVDITKSNAVSGATADQKAYAAFAAGLGKLAFGSSSLTEGLRDLAESFEDGKLETTDNFTITDIIDAVRDEAAESNIDVVERLESIEARVGEDGSFDPEPLDGAETDVAAGKALVGNIRTWLTSLEAFETPLDGFAGDVELAGEAFDAEAEAHAELFATVVDSIVETLDMAETKIGAHTVTVMPEGASDSTTFTATVAQTGPENGLVISIPTNTPIVGLENQTEVSINISTNLPAAILDEEPSFSISKLDLIVSGGISSPSTSLSLDEVALDYEAMEAVEIGGETEEDPDTKSVSLSGQLTLSRTVEQSDGTNKQYSFSGDATLAGAKLANASADADSDITLGSASLSGTIEASDNRSLTAGISIVMDNATTFDTIGFLNHDTYINQHVMVGGDLLSIHQNENNLTTPYGDGYYNINYNSHSNMTCYESHSVIANSPNGDGCYPGDALGINASVLEHVRQSDPLANGIEHVNFTFRYFDGSSETEFDAGVSLPDFETAESYLKATVTVTTALNLAGLPDSSIVLSAKRTGSEIGTASATIIQGSTEYFKVISEIAGDDVTGDVTFTNTDGAKLTIAPNASETAGVVSVNGKEVGIISERNGNAMITWADGSFESLI